jgi:hypothetical protein
MARLRHKSKRHIQNKNLKAIRMGHKNTTVSNPTPNIHKFPPLPEHLVRSNNAPI